MRGLILILLAVLVFVPGESERARAAGNDRIEDATVILNSAAVFDFDTTGYNAQPDQADPVVPCGGQAPGLEQQTHTAWFTFAPVTDGVFRASTEGTTGGPYVLVLWSAAGPATVGSDIDCNAGSRANTVPPPLYSEIPEAPELPGIALTPGQKYFLEVTSYQGEPGGPIHLSISYSGLLAEHPAPVLTSMSPGGAPVGSSSLEVTIAGSGFVASTTVDVGGTTLTPSQVTNSALTVVIPASVLVAESSLSVTVSNPAPGGGTSTNLTFAVYPFPDVVALAPMNVLVDSGVITVFLTGTGFRAGISDATVNGSPRSLAVTSPTAAEITLLAADTDEARLLDIVITNSSGGGAAASSQPRAVLVRLPLDTDCSGEISSADALHLLRILAGFAQALPGCPLAIEPGGMLAAVLEIRRIDAGLPGD